MKANSPHQSMSPGLNGDLIRLSHYLLNQIAFIEESRNALVAFSEVLTRLWAGSSRIKQRLSKSIQKTVQKGLVGTDKPTNTLSLATLLEQTEFILGLGSLLPIFIGSCVNFGAQLSQRLVNLSDDDKKRLVFGFLSQTKPQQLAQLVTQLFQIWHLPLAKEPERFAKEVASATKRFLETLDVGQIAQNVEDSCEATVLAAQAAQDELWQYPAKVISLFSLIPTCLRFTSRVTQNTLSRFNQIAPDLLTDIILSLVRELDLLTIAGCINQSAEIVKKLHTGSALLGQSGTPQWTQELAQILNKLSHKVDLESFHQARLNFLDGIYAYKHALVDLAHDHPEQVQRVLRSVGGSFNQWIRLSSRKLEAINDLLDDQETTDSLQQGIESVDLSELSEVVNLFAQLVNHLAQHKPRFLGLMMEGFVDALDPDLLHQCLCLTGENLGESLTPLVRNLLPSLLIGCMHCLSAPAGENEDQIEQARIALVKFLKLDGTTP